jgi:hypothetical protein
MIKLQQLQQEQVQSVLADIIGEDMAHYAFINDNNIVTEVIVGINEDNTETLPDGFADWEAWYGDFRGQTCKRIKYKLLHTQYQLTQVQLWLDQSQSQAQ